MTPNPNPDLRNLTNMGCGRPNLETITRTISLPGYLDDQVNGLMKSKGVGRSEIIQDLLNRVFGNPTKRTIEEWGQICESIRT